MRYRLQALPTALERALHERLLESGYSRATDEADALVVGLGARPEPATVLDLTPEQWSDTIGRARSAFTALRDHCAGLVARDAGGRAVIVVDPTAVRVVDGAGRTAVPGAFMTTMAQVAAVELGARGIAVNVLVAGWMEPAPAALARDTPLGRLAEPSEVAAACEFLLSEQASFVTGSTLVADGGYVITKGTGANPLR
jgi:NAD(P)-dependent dehydrogenase (short-subunit alcohol dehydrogenase family)